MFGDYHWRQVTRPRILARDGYVCKVRILKVCINLDSMPLPSKLLHVDHIKPRAEGGTDEDSNLRAACYMCNLHRAGGAPTPSRDW